jgi:predicted HicB family RNase H-like nuclease
MERFTLRLPEEVYEKIRYLAYKERKSQNTVIIEVLAKALESVEIPQEVKR